MWRTTMMFVVVAIVLGGGRAEAERPRPVRCCLMVPTDDGAGERPYCFHVRARPARYARKTCRRIGGRPAPRSEA